MNQKRRRRNRDVALAQGGGKYFNSNSNKLPIEFCEPNGPNKLIEMIENDYYTIKISNAAKKSQHSEPNWMFYSVFTGRVLVEIARRVSRDCTHSNFEKRHAGKRLP